MRRFDDFVDHKSDIIAQMAALLNEAQEGLEAGELSRSEFDEISHNILDFVEVDNLTSDVDNKVTIKEAIETLKLIAEHIPMT